MNFRLRPFVYVVALAMPLSTAAAMQHEPSDRIVAPIVSSERAPTNGVHPLAVKQNDLGRVNGSQTFHRMVLLLQGSGAQQADLAQLLKDQQDPSSPHYHQWLTPAEFGIRFGPSQNDISKVSNWLEQQGFSVEKAANGRRFLLFTGTSAQVESAFQTEMHRYSVNGKSYFANARQASIPAALAPVVRNIATLDSFGKAYPQYALAASPNILLGGYYFTGPADLAAIYDSTPLKTAGVQGQGQAVALIEESNINPQDVTDFRTVTGLPAANLNVIVNGPDPGLLPGEEVEAIADVSYAGAFAPNATLDFVVTASTEFNSGIDLSTLYAVDYAVAPITSLSYGGCETLNNTYYPGTETLYGMAYEQGAAEGISHFVSSGDNGGDGCLFTGLSAGYGVNALGSSPFNVSVGGTEFIMPNPADYFPPPNYTATGYVPESTWNDYENPYDGRSLAGTGGVSMMYSKPAWQSGPGVPADGQRDVPDVSLVAGDNLAYLVCERDLGANCSQGYAIGLIGTSLAAPSWASIQALVNQQNALVGGAGNPNPSYYALAAGSKSPFHDITQGDTKVPDPDGQLVGYAATTGYDLATGLGSVDVNKLATNWMPPTGSGKATVALTASASTITHGDPLTANVSVTASGSTIPTGDVALMAGAQGVIQLTLGATGTTSFGFGSSSGVVLPGGSYNLTAHYAGDANFAPATSSAVAITVNPETTTTLGGSSVATSVPYGSAITVGAETVGNNSGTNYVVGGTYTFTENAATLGTASVFQPGESFAFTSTGVAASLTLSGATALGAGTHKIVAASPAASASFLASASTPITVTVTQGAVLVSLTPDHTTPALNSKVNLLASVINLYGASVPVTGNVDFWDGSAKLGTAALPATADYTGAYDVTLPVTFTTAGLHVLQAVYDGSTNNAANASGLVNVTVGGKSTTSTTILGTGFGLAGNAVAILATVTADSNGTAATGTVTFTDTNVSSGSGTVVGTATLVGGKATLTTSTLADGNHLITASYGGDSNYSGSVSDSISEYIGDFTLAASTSSASVTAGQTAAPITLTYTGSADFTLYGGPSQFTSGVTLACSGLPSGAACSFSSNPIQPTDTSKGTTTGATMLTITTTGPTLTKASVSRPKKFFDGGLPVTLAGLLVLGVPFAVRRRLFSRLIVSGLLGLGMLAVLGGISACGGGTTSYTVTSPGTAAGTSTVTITATLNGGAAYGTLSHTSTVSLTVVSATGQ